MRFKAALIDFDGTLEDSMPWWLGLPRQSFLRAGIEPPAELEKWIRTVPMWELSARLCREWPALEAEGPLLDQWMARMKENYIRRIPLKAGASELLDELRARSLTLVILSATGRDLLEPAMAAHGLDRRVDLVFSEAEAGSKHTEAPYRFLAGRLGLAAEEMILIEDAVRNIETASILGLGTVGVYDETMAPYQEELRRLADVYLPDLRDLSPLKKLWE